MSSPSVETSPLGLTFGVASRRDDEDESFSDIMEMKTNEQLNKIPTGQSSEITIQNRASVEIENAAKAKTSALIKEFIVPVAPPEFSKGNWASIELFIMTAICAMNLGATIQENQLQFLQNLKSIGRITDEKLVDLRKLEITSKEDFAEFVSKFQIK